MKPEPRRPKTLRRALNADEQMRRYFWQLERRIRESDRVAQVLQIKPDGVRWVLQIERVTWTPEGFVVVVR